MTASLFLPAFACALLLPVISQADPPSSSPQEQVARLITQLGSKKFAEREAAASALDALGESALKGLRAAQSNPDLEVSRRADEVLARVERRLETARLLAPRKVRLVYNEVRILDALNDAARKLELPLEFDGDRTRLAERTVTLDTGEVSPWEALAKFEQAAGLVERPPQVSAGKQQGRLIEIQNGVMIQGQGRLIITSSYQDARSPYDNRILLAEDKRQPPAAHDAGAVRIRALPPGQAPSRAALEELLRHQDAAALKDIPVSLEVIHQPHLAWHGVVDVRVGRAVDEYGQELKPSPTDASPAALNGAWARNGAVFVGGDLDFALGYNYGRQWPLRLKPGARPSKVLRELTGTVSTQVEVGPEPLITIDDVFQTGGRTHSAADGTMLKVLSATRAENGQIQVRLEVLTSPMFFAGGGPARIGRRNVQVAPIFPGGNGSTLPLALLDRAGNPVPLVGTTVPQQVLGFGVPQELVLLFEPRADATKLVYTGKRMVVLEIPFTLRDIPLP